MANDLKILNEIMDYVKQLRLHTEGRRALHIRISLLERTLQSGHYRRLFAANFVPLKNTYGAVSYVLPNHDLLFIIKDAPLDAIDRTLNEAKRGLNESGFLKTLDPIQGVSDAFVEWFDLEAEYGAFSDYVAGLTEAFQEGLEIPIRVTPDVDGIETPSKKTKKVAEINPETGLIKIKPQSNDGTPPPKAPAKKLQAFKVNVPKQEIKRTEFNTEMLTMLQSALASVDMNNLLREQPVMVIVRPEAKQTIMVHHIVPFSAIFEKFLTTIVTDISSWFTGALQELITSRILVSKPKLRNKNSFASSIRVTVASVLSTEFDLFNEVLEDQPRNNIILEFSCLDVMGNFGFFVAAKDKITALGFKVCIADFDIRALDWLNLGNFQSDFIKVNNPLPAGQTWLNHEEDRLKAVIKKIGNNRVIITDCNMQDDILFGQRLGATMFQGDAVTD